MSGFYRKLKKRKERIYEMINICLVTYPMFFILIRRFEENIKYASFVENIIIVTCIYIIVFAYLHILDHFHILEILVNEK